MKKLKASNEELEKQKTDLEKEKIEAKSKIDNLEEQINKL